MASSVAHDPLPSPPPAYLRETPPFTTQESIPRTTPDLSQGFSFAGAAVRSMTPDHDILPPIQHSPRASVRIDTGADIPPASTVKIETLSNGPPTPQLELSNLSIDDLEFPRHTWNPLYQNRKDSSQADAYQAHTYGHTPGSSGSWSIVDSQLKSEAQEKSHHPIDHNGNSRPSSPGSLESTDLVSEGYEPLPYHHQQLEQAAQTPKPILGAGLVDHPAGMSQRPLSTYSSGSDRGPGHRRNLSASPYLHARSSSRNSAASADNRSASALDLLNTSYPQPGPTVGQMDNSHLQASVGNNASLLSHKQTFEMYLANVKKTDEPAVLYEFAVFMINSMREMPMGDLKDDNKISRVRLLQESKSILQRLADRSYPFAQYYLADGYASGLFNKDKEDHERAFHLFKAASKHGHIEACYRTALCYEFGWGCRADGGRAVQFYRQAASKNHPGAMLRMAKACLAGDMGLGKRYREGIKWLKRAAETSDAQYNSAPYELGILHETGYGDDVFPDASYAAQLITKSAELGHVEACYRMGDAYEHGKLNCPRDPALSIHFYTSAAQNGHALAMMALCAWYLVGAEPILERDEDEAYEWAVRAANLGLAKAQYAAGYFTETGIGCRRDVLAANVWYVKAADQGDARAKHRLAVIRAAADGVPQVAEKRTGRLSKSAKNDDPEKSKKKRFVIM
ncbi:hypothetical protein N7470_001576 [Penicillium chermesinum]|nr:hypothetical protein N7470_001576 [Penicillium chermesinum]